MLARVDDALGNFSHCGSDLRGVAARRSHHRPETQAWDGTVAVEIVGLGPSMAVAAAMVEVVGLGPFMEIEPVVGG